MRALLRISLSGEQLTPQLTSMLSMTGQHEASSTAAELHWASHVPMMTAAKATAKMLRMTSAAMRGDSKSTDAC